MDEWMDRWMNGWMDGWMDGWISPQKTFIPPFDTHFETP